MARIERAKNATRNIVYGVILKMYQILIPFVMRTAMIYLMGVQYLGLNSLFSSVLQVLNLAELGVGSAMVYSMYGPIVKDDNVTICALMKLYRTYYRFIGGVIAVVGVFITPFIPKLISGDVPADINIYILYLLNLGATVLSYWLFAYKNSILQAHQRNDVVSKVTIVTNTIQYALQLFVLWVFHNYYYYVIVMLFTQAATNIVTALYANKLYPDFKPEGNLGKKEVSKINQRIKDLFTSKLGGVIVGAADTIVISSFLGLTALAVYQNYYFIISSVTGFIYIINSSICAGIGNSLITESNEKNYHDFEKFNFVLFWLIGFCICCFLTLMQPFVQLWVGKKLMLPFGMVVLFCIYFFCNVYEKAISVFKDAAGIWREDRFRPLIYGISNLIVNLILVNYIGLYGIIISTIVTCLAISIPWIIDNVFKLIYKRSKVNYVKALGKYVITIGIAGSINVLVCNMFRLSPFFKLVINGVISLVIPNLIFFLTYKNNPLFKESLQLAKKMIKSRN